MDSKATIYSFEKKFSKKNLKYNFFFKLLLNCTFKVCYAEKIDFIKGKQTNGIVN